MMEIFNNANAVGFYALGFVVVFASLRVITHANPVHAILSMIVSLLAVAGIFFILGAPFAGILEIIVYAGAILVLFVFVIMMLNLGTDNDTHEKTWLSADTWAMPMALGVVVFAVLCGLILTASKGSYAADAQLKDVTVGIQAVGVRLFSHYVLLVQAAAFLLLGALVAAYHLGKKALDDENVSHTQEQADEYSSSQADTQPNLINEKSSKSVGVRHG
ncbi:MAG: NADH-quinone oxidoreductase subunit J [Moraxella sp.]|nr:NADH-quinone oxidoreductase subunit J [Moraxella sp.]